jgi:hypothetical protein
MLQHQGVLAAVSDKRGSILLWLGLLTVFASFWWCDGSAFPFPWAILPVAGTLLCLLAVSAAPDGYSAPNRFLAHPLTVYIGRLSYSLYLWHWPVYAIFRWTLGLSQGYMVLALGVTFALAALSYHFVEQPVRASRWVRRQSPPSKVVAGLVLVALLAWASNGLFANKSVFDLSVTRDVYHWYPHPHPEPQLETQPQPLAGRKLIVVGNSHTPAYTTMLQKAHDQLGVEVMQIPMGKCSLGDLVESVAEKAGCDGPVRDLLVRLENERGISCFWLPCAPSG